MFSGLVDIQSIDSTIVVDLMYSKADNFVGEKMYSREINPSLRLIIYDAARPMSVQQKMWNKVKGTRQQNYVSNPANGGGLHNYGLAVDVSIVDAKGDTLPMGTRVDALTSLSHIDRESELVRRGKISTEARRNRELLRMVMQKAGFRSLRSEWWHFNYTTRADAKANYRVVK